MKSGVNFAIGTDDFAEIINKKATYIDKTPLIRSLIDDLSSVILFTRPRRFGKTLNMSMLKYFFGIRENAKDLFKNLAITQDPEIWAHQGKYPVIYISLKEVKKDNFQNALKAIQLLIQKLFSSYQDLRESIVPEYKTLFDRFLHGEASATELELSLEFLSSWLCKKHSQKAWILIDEYDTPIHEAWEAGYYHEMKSFMQGFLGSALKGNTSVYKGILTGILRVSKEGMFSELNNIKVHSMLSENYGEYFGFTESEVDSICERADLLNPITQREAARAWYNGYKFGNIAIYNPWSIINFATDKKLMPYWVHTGNNKLIETLIAKSAGNFKADFQVLIQGGSVQKLINENITLPAINSNSEESLWNFLLFAGYLKIISIEYTNQGPLCELQIPNEEIMGLYKNYFGKWIEQVSAQEGAKLLRALTEGDVLEFQALLQEFMETSFSYFDLDNKNPEKVYHALILGMLVSLRASHEISSNGEAAYGRYDVVIIPKDISKLGLVLEFKAVREEKLMKKSAKKALEQINTQGYAKKLEARGIKKILKLALIFCGKKVLVKDQN